MDREGEYTFSLRPKTEKYSHRVLCEVAVEDNVKVVTLRSTYRVVNQTLYPLEITIVDENGQPVRSLEKIGGMSTSLPQLSTDPASQCLARIMPFRLKALPKIAYASSRTVSFNVIYSFNA